MIIYNGQFSFTESLQLLGCGVLDVGEVRIILGIDNIPEKVGK
jgi:hypothetical protein